jgi:hypothetical protein
MFRRVILDDWASVIPIVSFVIFFSVFLIATIRAVRLAEKNRDHLASLPLDSATDSSSSQSPTL